MFKGFSYKKCSWQFYKNIPTVSSRIWWSRSLNVSEILSVAILSLLGCRQGLQLNASLSLLTTEVTADVSAQEILSVLSKIAFNTWAFQFMTQIRIVILQMFKPLGEPAQCQGTADMHPFFLWVKRLADWRLRDIWDEIAQ